MVNVNAVYQTVLLILNQQQRGYITPDEFNKIGTQAQLTMFEAYASDLNQQYRLPQNDTEYANRVKNIEDKLQFFQRTATPTYDVATGTFPTLDFTDLYGIDSITVIITDSHGCYVEDDFIVYVGNIWNGNIDTDWHTVGNWTTIVPDCNVICLSEPPMVKSP